MTGFWMAWGMFTILPCPVKKWDSAQYAPMLLCLPLIGLGLGALWSAGAWVLTGLFHTGLFGAAVLAALPGCLSGFLHWDGYMDCADAVLSRRERSERLRILKDSRVGAFAVIAMALWLLLAFSLCAGIDWTGKRLWLLFVPAVCRACAALFVLVCAPLPGSGYAALPALVRRRHRWLAGGELAALLALPVALWGAAGLFAAAGAAGSALMAALLRRNLGGMSGDISGAAITVGELCALAAICAA